jgi:hypothetical protein
MSGNTKVKIEGTGLRNKEGMYLKWGNECVPVEEGKLDNELIGYSAPATNSTTGGSVFVEIGYNSEMEEINNESFILYNDYTSDKL